MEYTIYNESLICYILQKDGKYLDCNNEINTYNMAKAKLFTSLEDAKLEAWKLGCEVRKVKMIDIGGWQNET